MRTLGAALVSAGLWACGSSSNGPAEPTACDPSTQQVGAYLWQYTTVSGNCGAIAELVVDWPAANDQTAADGTTCAPISDTPSEGNCKDVYVFECTTAAGERYDYTRVLTQETADGSLLRGVLSMSASGPAGTCVGTYDVTLTRQ
ncbi:MAG TPA: hypothetical protein VMI75_38595 [Polyangiaceae bacterium]|nr:hypothetical protein [Polyangiaceae bacterium]